MKRDPRGTNGSSRHRVFRDIIVERVDYKRPRQDRDSFNLLTPNAFNRISSYATSVYIDPRSSFSVTTTTATCKYFLTLFHSSLLHSSYIQ